MTRNARIVKTETGAPRSKAINAGKDDRSEKEIRGDWLLDRQIDLPLYGLAAVVIAHALSGTSSFSLPHLSTHLPHSIQTLLPAWARHLPILAPFATELPNASHDSKFISHGETYWSSSPTGYAGPFRSDAVGFGHPLTALHNLTRACLGLSYQVREESSKFASSFMSSDDLRYSQSYFDRYPWNSWIPQNDQGTNFLVQTYEKGYKDVFLVLTGILVFTVLRAVTVRYVLVPMANAVVPLPASKGSRTAQAKALRQTRRTCLRFAEQAWIAVWGTFSVSLSLYVASQETYWNNELALWQAWPLKRLTGLTKSYYLLQTAFWIQQVIVLNVEDRRNDHWQMLSHHVVTILLLLGSYTSHFTPIGNVILTLMDPCDVLLAIAKCLRYAGQQMLCDIGFGAFMVSWIVTRHVLYNRALYSCIVKARIQLPEYPGATRHDWFGFRTFVAFALVVLLCVLQVILCIWLVMIVRVAWRVVSGKGATDTRSDDDDSEVERNDNEKPSSLAEKAINAATEQATTSAHVQVGKKQQQRR